VLAAPDFGWVHGKPLHHFFARIENIFWPGVQPDTVKVRKKFFLNPKPFYSLPITK
jgi:hypothetical protein